MNLTYPARRICSVPSHREMLLQRENIRLFRNWAGGEILRCGWLRRGGGKRGDGDGGMFFLSFFGGVPWCYGNCQSIWHTHYS